MLSTYPGCLRSGPWVAAMVVVWVAGVPPWQARSGAGEADALLCRGSRDWVREAARTPVVDVGCAMEAADLAQNVLLKVVPEGSGVVWAPRAAVGLLPWPPTTPVLYVLPSGDPEVWGALRKQLVPSVLQWVLPKRRGQVAVVV